jgi:hypothetical protein
VFTSEIAPLADHTPLLKVEVTAPEVAVLKVPAAVVESVSVAVRLPPSESEATISIRLSGTSSTYVSAALRLVALGEAAKRACVGAIKHHAKRNIITIYFFM